MPLLLLLSQLTMVGAGGPDRGSKAAVMAAPKIIAPKINADMIPITISSCFFDGPHPTSLLLPWVWSELGWNDNFMLRLSGSCCCAGFSRTVFCDLSFAL